MLGYARILKCWSHCSSDIILGLSAKRLSLLFYGQEEIHRIQDLQYLLSLPGCLPPHKRGELGATYGEVRGTYAFC